MPDPSPDESIARAIRRLTSAVWVLAAVTAAGIIVSFLPYIAPSRFSSIDAHSNFHEWPIDKQVQSASVIAIARWQQADGRLRCVFSEILKQAPNTIFYYKVGDEYPRSTVAIRDNTSYGDGLIMFFTGSPATFRFSSTFTGDRIAGMGDMPLSELRAAVQQRN